jgi:hypothetical protein
MAAGALLFGGDLYVNRIVNGVALGEEGPIEGTTFEIKANVNVKELVSKGRNTSGQVRESVNLAAPADFSVTFADASPATLALALMGDVSALTQAAAAATDYTVIAVLDKWVSTGKGRFTGVVTVKNALGTITYVSGTDYLFNAELGTVKALVGGAITALQSIRVNGAILAISGSLIQGGTTPDLRARFRLDGKSLVDGSACVVIVDEAIIAPNAAVNFLSDDFITMPLTGRMKTQPGQTAAFRVELRA